MSAKTIKVHAMEINAAMIGALFTERVGDRLRVFCFYLNGDTGQFDVPEEENKDSLYNLFARLDMPGQCSSVILEKVVRGRVYTEQDGEMYSYTLLSTPEDVLPPLNADICRMPWKTIWSGDGAEVLRLAGVGRQMRCFAVRSRVSEVDASQLYRSANAFVNPRSFNGSIRQQNPILRQVVAGCLLVVALSLGLTLGYQFGYNRANAARPMAATPTTKPTQNPGGAFKAHALLNQKIQGPFTMHDLAAMKSEGKLTPDALFRLEGSTEWVAYDALPWPLVVSANTRRD